MTFNVLTLCFPKQSSHSQNPILDVFSAALHAPNFFVRRSSTVGAKVGS